MGMFDTFWGEYKCTACGDIVRFEEQTKDYDQALEDFYLGDYVDRGNRNYFYNFTSWCPKCHADHEISIAIRRGQYIGVFYKYEADEINILDLDNIEDGYQRKRVFEKMCREKLGIEDRKLTDELDPKHVGDYIMALRTKWQIQEVYQETPIESSNAVMRKLFFKENVVYRATDGTDNRIIAIREGGILGNVFIEVCTDNLEQKDDWKDEDKNRYIIQHDCALIRIE